MDAESSHGSGYGSWGSSAYNGATLQNLHSWSYFFIALSYLAQTCMCYLQTEQDFAAVAGAGLNFVRIPIGYWAIETWPNEPFLPKVSWTYVISCLGDKLYLKLFPDTS